MNRMMPQTQDYSPQFVAQRPPVFQQRVRYYSPSQKNTYLHTKTAEYQGK